MDLEVLVSGFTELKYKECDLVCGFYFTLKIALCNIKKNL